MILRTGSTSLAATAFIALSAPAPALAEHHEGPQFAPVELMACQYKEGKNAENRVPLTKAFSAWADEYDPSYAFWILTPIFREDNDMDYAWIGAWPSGADFGKSWDAWMKDSGSAGPMFDDVSECNGSMVASTTIHNPMEVWPKQGTTWFSRCTLQEGATMMDAIAAHRGMAKAMEEMGATPSMSWAFLPGLGFGDVEFDYYHVESWASFEALGSSFETYFNKGGWKKGSAMDEVTECASPNLYHFEMIRGGN